MRQSSRKAKGSREHAQRQVSDQKILSLSSDIRKPFSSKFIEDISLLKKQGRLGKRIWQVILVPENMSKGNILEHVNQQPNILHPSRRLEYVNNVFVRWNSNLLLGEVWKSAERYWRSTRVSSMEGLGLQAPLLALWEAWMTFQLWWLGCSCTFYSFI